MSSLAFAVMTLVGSGGTGASSLSVTMIVRVALPAPRAITVRVSSS